MTQKVSLKATSVCGMESNAHIYTYIYIYIYINNNNNDNKINNKKKPKCKVLFDNCHFDCFVLKWTSYVY